MNNVAQPKTFSAAIMLFLFLLASFVGAEGTLLCFGKDGHMAVEFVDACNGRGLGSELAGTESDACGTCIDVQFQNSAALSNHRPLKVSPHATLFSFQPVPAVQPSSFIRETQTRSSVPVRISLTSLSSVVLRI